MSKTPRTDAALEADSGAGSTKELVALCRELEQARRKLLLDLWDALPGHEASGDCAGSLRAMLLFSEVGDEIRSTRTGETGAEIRRGPEAGFVDGDMPARSKYAGP